MAGVVTLLLVVNGRVLFRARDFATTAELLRAMYLARGGTTPSPRDAARVVGMFAIVVGAMLVAGLAPRLSGAIRVDFRF